MTHWIAGEWIAGQGDAMQSASPYDGEVIWQGDSATPAQVESAVTAARTAFFIMEETDFLTARSCGAGFC